MLLIRSREKNLSTLSEQRIRKGEMNMLLEYFLAGVAVGMIVTGLGLVIVSFIGGKGGGKNA